MGILIPSALALLALAVPIILLYMLRMRRRERTVSSSLLWQRALLDRTANAPWQRIRRNLLLLLQLLALLLIALALARPYFNIGTVAAGSVVVVLDASASMQAADSTSTGSTRFERAKNEAARVIEGIAGGDRVALVWAGPAAVLAAAPSEDKAALSKALRGMAPSNGSADMVEALTLAAGQARQMGDAAVVLLSDGAVAARSGGSAPEGGLARIPRMPGKARYVNVGSSPRNVGITALSLRDAPGGPQLFASVYNSGPDPVQALLSISVDGQLRDSRRLLVGPGADASATLQGLPLDTRVVEASLRVDAEGANLLPTDDRAWAVRGRAPGANVLLVSEGNSFLEKALPLMPGVKLFKARPESFAPSDSFGVTVLDAVMPSTVPPGNLLMFAPPDSPLIPVSGTLQFPGVGASAANDPLMRFVDLSGLHVAAAAHIQSPSWARVLLATDRGEPLIIVGETGGRKVAAVAFDLHRSDLPLQVAFPVLLANLIGWLQPSSAVDASPLLGPGDPVSIRALPQTDQIVVTVPGREGVGGGGRAGKQVTLKPQAPLSFADTDQPGLYTVEQFSKGKPVGEAERFAVNLFNREESNIAPRPDFRLEGAGAAASSDEARRPLEIWPWVLLAAIVLLAVEWWYYNRGSLARLRFPRARP